MQKRLQALLLTALMVWTLAAPAMGANPFFDVPEDHWAYDAISYLAEAGLVEGYPDGTFGGSRNFTRYEMALVFARIVARFEKHVDELVDQGIQSRLEELAGEVSAGIGGPAGALKVAEEAKATAGYALDVAVGILDAIDAREWDPRLEAAARQADKALHAAEQAQATAQEAIDVAVGILEVVDSRNWDARLDSIDQRTDEAWTAAKQAQEAAEQAVEVAVGILDAIDARDWDSRIDSAARNADEALALARRLSGADSSQGDAPLFSGAARAAIEEIAAAYITENVATQADLATARALIESEASRLEKAIMDLTTEFGTELEILGVRVARIESKVLAHDEELRAIRAELDRVKVSGSNETSIIRGEETGNATKLYNDPRDEDSGEFDVPDNRIVNRTQIRIDAKLNDDVDLVGAADIVLDDTFLGGSLGNVLKDSRLYVEATTQNPVRVIRIGSLDAERVAETFSPYLLDAKRFGETSMFGAFANIVSGQMEHDVFGGQLIEDDRNVAGFSSYVPLGPDLELAVSAVRLNDGANTRSGLSLASAGDLDGLAYDVTWTRDIEKEQQAYSFVAELPVESATVTASMNRIDAIWNDADRLPFASKVKLQSEADVTIDKVADIDNPIFANQSLSKVRIDAPIGSFNAFAQLGRYSSVLEDPTTGPVSDSFTQLGVTDLDLFGFNVDYTRTSFQDLDFKNLTDQRTNLFTRVEEMDLNIAIHKQQNEQADVVAGEEEQNHFMVSLARPVHILLPWTGTMEFGTSFTTTYATHSAYKLTLDEYEFMPDLLINAEIGAENNVIEDGEWRKNANWSGDNQTTRAIDAVWHFAEPMNILGGYKVVDSVQDGKTVTQDAGVEYVLDAFGGDLTVGYGYRIVRTNGAVDGSGRSTITAAFTRTAGGFSLDAEAKHVIGGTVDEKGNDVDTIASLQLAYPVFTGADFTINGKYVGSQGQKVHPDDGPREEYTATSLMAGLKFNF